MSDLTDNQFYPSAEWIWLCIRFAKWTSDRLIEDSDFGKKKIIFPDEAHFDLGRYVNKQNCRIWVIENKHAYIEKPTHPKRVNILCWGMIGPFFFENEQGEAITVNGDRYWAMLKRRILTTFVFNRTALRAIQPKLHSMFCALFLKIALSAAELMSFDYLGGAIWHLWTIICGMLSKICVTSVSQRQLTL